MASNSSADRIPKDVWRIALVVVFGAFMAGLDTSLVTIGLDTMSRRLHGSLGAAQWLTSGYLISLAAALPLCGWLGRRVGATRLWLYSLATFTVLSFLCATSSSLAMLIVFRVLQGAAGGLLVPSGQTIVGAAAGPRHMGRVMNTAGIAVILAPAIGPAVGGMLISAFSWRWLFLVNVPIGAIAFAVGMLTLPREAVQRTPPLDVAGLLLLCTGLPLVTYGVIEASALRTIASVPVLATLPVGLAALCSYIVHDLRRDAARPPILNLRLFARPAYAASQLSVFFCGASLFGGLTVLPLYYEILRHRSVAQTGLLLLAYGIGSAVSLRLGGTLTDRIGGGRTASIGLVLTIAATLPFTRFGSDANLLLVEALQFMRGIGVSFAGLPVMSSAYALVSRDDLPDATVQASILQRIGGSLGSALFVIVLNRHQPVGLDAFQDVFGWLMLTAVAALMSAGWLAVEQRHTRTTHETTSRTS